MARWNTVAIYGVGLIGGSIGRALRTRELARRVIGIGRQPQRLQKAVELGAITDYCTQLEDGAAIDVAIICTPVQWIAEHCAQIYRHAPAAVLSDVGSTKRRVVADVEAKVPAANFIGSHPLAGSDRTGVEHADADLFVDHCVVVTPTAHSERPHVEQIEELWRALGARVVEMSPEEHDRALASTSHLPHVIASALAAETPEEYLHLIAGGWRDSTRIAAADVELWTQILQENHEYVAAALRQLQARLQQFQTAIGNNDFETITRLMAAGKQRRDAVGS